MIDAGNIIDAKLYTTEYEHLRSQVMGAAGEAARGNTGGQSCGTGLALLLREGMPGWLRAVEGVLRTSLTPRAVDPPIPAPHDGSAACSASPVWLSNVLRDEVTALLASLVLSTRPLARPSSMEACRSW